MLLSETKSYNPMKDLRIILPATGLALFSLSIDNITKAAEDSFLDCSIDFDFHHIYKRPYRFSKFMYKNIS